MDVGQLFKNAKIQYWPEYWLVICGACLVVVLTGVVAGRLDVPWLLLFGGLCLFGFGAKIAHYRERDKKLSSNVWVSKWRHSFMADVFALCGFCLVGLAFFQWF
jgi:hypothetical protein